MGQLELKTVTKDLVAQAEREIVPQHRLGEWLDDYFVGELKRVEMEHAEVDTRLYEGLRRLARSELAPVLQAFWAERERICRRRDNRKLSHYVLGTLVVLELIEIAFSRGRSLLPQILVPTAIFYAFIGFVIYSATQYLDDRQLARARARLEAALEGLDRKAQTDADYDNRRELLQGDVLQAEALEVLAAYPRPEDFWRDYLRVRQADPTSASAVQALRAPGFEKFLKFHVQGVYSAAARQNRFNRLFIEAQEIFVSRDRQEYVLQHLNAVVPAPQINSL
jgi:hypothetical protein